jgi:hypothetical protein
MIPFSVLDLSPVPEGGDAGQALRNTLDLAQAAERLGFRRYWLAEHHNMAGIASAATAVVIGAVAAATSTIRVGSGGIMLPNHAPLVIAEQFGTLEARSIPAGSTSGSAARPAPIRSPPARSGATSRLRPSVFRRTSWSCRPCSRPLSRARRSGRCRGRA